MGRWLKKISKVPSSTPSKPPKSPLEGLEGESGRVFPENSEGSESSGSISSKSPGTPLEGLEGVPTGTFLENAKGLSGSQISAPVYEIDVLVDSLARGARRDLGLPLVNRLREVLAPMGRGERATLAGAVDDAFGSAQSLEEARQLVAGILDAHAPKRPHRDTLAGCPAWIDWIADQCPLVPEDRAFVERQLRTLPAKARERTARRYVEIWRTAAAAESMSHAKDNRGRTAANRSLLALVR